MRRTERYSFNDFYDGVIDRLLALKDAPMDADNARTKRKLNKVREFLEYIQDRELYRRAAYKDDVMVTVRTFGADGYSFDSLLNAFDKGQQVILNGIYAKDKAVEVQRREGR